jgi:hypothetical protein
MGEARRRKGASSDLEQPCYRAALYQGARPIRIAVWNGRKDYESHPPDELINAIGGPRLLLLQVGPSSVITLSDHVDEADSIILWAANADIYRNTVDTLQRLATLRADGKPIDFFGRSSLEDLLRHDWAQWRARADKKP